jgi:hypothetical protein
MLTINDMIYNIKGIKSLAKEAYERFWRDGRWHLCYSLTLLDELSILTRHAHDDIQPDELLVNEVFRFAPNYKMAIQFVASDKPKENPCRARGVLTLNDKVVDTCEPERFVGNFTCRHEDREFTISVHGDGGG